VELGKVKGGPDGAEAASGEAGGVMFWSHRESACVGQLIFSCEEDFSLQKAVFDSAPSPYALSLK